MGNRAEQMKMKIYLIIILLFPIPLYGQSCDTLYSHENYIMRGVKIEYRDCQSITVDSTYTIVQWNNVDSNYLMPFYSDNVCYSLFHSLTGKLIQQRWQNGDTIYFKSYYSSGKLRSSAKSVFTSEPYYFHEIKKEFYENGQILYEGEYKSSSYSVHKRYYKNGQLEFMTNRFSYNPGSFGEEIEYFPNGQVSHISRYSEPDTSTNHFQSSELLDEKFFDENGNEVNLNQNEWKVMNVAVYPPYKNEILQINDTLYTHHQFYNIKEYSNDMAELKFKILDNLKILKNSNCTKGIIWISLFIKKDGSILVEDVQFSDDSIKQSLKRSIKKIKHWPAGIVDGEKVDTYVYTYLILDK